MYSIFDRILQQSLDKPSQSYSGSSGQPEFGTSVGQAIANVRKGSSRAKQPGDPSAPQNVTDIYKNRMITQAARGEGPWANAFNNGGVNGDLPQGLNQNDAMNYQIQRQVYLDAKKAADEEESRKADEEWRNHLGQKYGMMSSIPGEGN